MWSSVAVRVFLEDDEVPQQLEESLPVENAANQDFQFQNGWRGRLFARNGPPHLEPFLVGRQRTDPGLQAVRDDQRLVVVEQRRNFLLVGLQLVPGVPDRGVLVGGVLEFDHAQRQPVDEHHDVGPAVVLALDHRELVDDQPIVVGRLVEIDQPHPIAANRAVRRCDTRPRPHPAASA